MYAAVRRYEGITDDAEAGRPVRESFMPLLEHLSGFIAYYWVDAGEGVMASLMCSRTGPEPTSPSRVHINGFRRTLPRSSRTRCKSRKAWSARATRSKRGGARPAVTFVT